MNRLLTPFRVGLVVLIGGVAFVILALVLGNQRYSRGETYRLYATFADASGLGTKSRVQIAGIEVGLVDSIKLTEDAKALVTLRIRKDVKLHRDARITKRSASLLGDFVLDIFPGTPGTPVLKDGDTLEKAVGQPGVDDVFVQLGEVTRDIEGVTKGLKDLLASDEVGSIKNIIRSMNSVADGLNRTIAQAGGRLDLILGDAQKLTSSVRELADSQGGNVTEIIENVRRFTIQANKVITGINQIVGSGGGDLKQSVASVRDTLDEFQRALKGAEGMVASVKGTADAAHDIVQRVDNGEGTLGKLVRDDTIATNLNNTLGAVDTALKPLNQLHLDARLLGEVHYRPGLPASYDHPWLKGGVALRLVTDPTFYYGLDVVSDPRGSTTKQVVTENSVGTTVSPTAVQSVVTTDEWKVSAYVAKRLGPVAFRAGVIESTGGLGMDAYLAHDHVRLMVDAFDFDDVYAQYPRLRAQAQFSFFGHLFVGLGVDDILNEKPVLQDGRFLAGTDGFVGGGVIFSDDDVMQVLRVASGKK